MPMLSPDEAHEILQAATFRIHLGDHPDDDGVSKPFFGTGFFVARHAPAGPRDVRPAESDGFALTAWHNFKGCSPGQVFDADYKGTTIQVRWIAAQSSERADIAAGVLHRALSGDRCAVPGVRGSDEASGGGRSTGPVRR
jgi:hypothetical protein